MLTLLARCQLLWIALLEMMISPFKGYLLSQKFAERIHQLSGSLHSINTNHIHSTGLGSCRLVLAMKRGSADDLLNGLSGLAARCSPAIRINISRRCNSSLRQPHFGTKNADETHNIHSTIEDSIIIFSLFDHYVQRDLYIIMDPTIFRELE
jgi:hypothetical protein